MKSIRKMNSNFLPKLNVGLLLTTKFGLSYYHTSLHEFLNPRVYGYEKLKELSQIQRDLYSYSIVEGQVCNGGFVQLIFNNYIDHLDGAIRSLELIGQVECKEIIEQAKVIAKNKRGSFFLARFRGLKGLFNKTIYEKNKTLDDLDNDFYTYTSENDILFRKYIWDNREKLISKESIPEILPRDIFTEYDTGSMYQKYTITSNGITGWYEENFDSGLLKFKKKFNNGEYLHESFTYNENGLLKETTKAKEGKVVLESYNNEGIKLSTNIVHPITYEADGKYTIWYPSGNIRSTGFKQGYRGYGELLWYYENGKLRSRGISRGYNSIVNEFYLENGEQTIFSGDGIMLRNEIVKGVHQTWKEEFKNGVRNGKSELIIDGKTQEISIYRNGERVS